MRSTAVGLSLAAAIPTVAVLLAGCATGGASGRTTPPGAPGGVNAPTTQPGVAVDAAPAATPSGVAQREARARALLAMGDLDGAADELRALLRQSPDAVQARYALAVTLMAKQDWSAARSELDEVLRRQPDMVPALYSLGLVRYAQGDPSGAMEAYRQVLVRNPQHADAHYNLALLLKLTHRDAEATPEFLAAARAGHARAQFFAGTAYARGLGVEADLARAIAWWSRAAEQGSLEAGAALAELRQAALGKVRRGPAERRAVEQAFRDYRAGLWSDYPDLTKTGDDDTVGAALLRHGRGAEAVPVLISEALAFSEPAQTLLEDVYARGAPGQVLPHDTRILSYFKTAAAEGQVRAQRVLQEISAAAETAPPSSVRP